MRPWDSLSDDERRLFVRMAEVFAGYISYYDDRLGRLLDYLEESGQLENTLIVAVSDNGASGEGGPNGSFNEWRFFNGVPDTAETTLPHIDELGTPASNNHYNTGWAWALDTPFPYWKRWAGYEGGTADMCLVAWPATIPPQDVVRQQYIHAVDVVPTIYELLGVEPPETINGYPQLPIEGESFAAALADPQAPGKRTQFYAMLGQRAIYHDGWLACTVHPPLSGWGRFEEDVWELYHLESDRAQARNVADDHPVMLERLKSLWFYEAGRCNGLPLDDRTAIEQVLAERPRAAAPRDRYVFYPDCADVPESAGPVITGRSYTIAAGVRIDSADAEGVVWAAGGVPGGHALYLKDRRLRYAFNWIGTTLQEVVGETEITPGAHVLSAEFVAEGHSGRRDAGDVGHAHAVRRRRGDRQWPHRHPAGVLLPDRRRHLRRARQRLGGDARLRGAVPLHGRDDRQGRRRRLRRAATATTRPTCAPGSRSTDRVGRCVPARVAGSGASRDRTGDLLLAKQALSQLSYGPARPSLATREEAPPAHQRGASRTVTSVRAACSPGATRVCGSPLVGSGRWATLHAEVGVWTDGRASRSEVDARLEDDDHVAPDAHAVALHAAVDPAAAAHLHALRDGKPRPGRVRACR